MSPTIIQVRNPILDPPLRPSGKPPTRVPFTTPTCPMSTGRHTLAPEKILFRVSPGREDDCQGSFDCFSDCSVFVRGRFPGRGMLEVSDRQKCRTRFGASHR